tara:strand:+ start:1539 stop:1928 length:390 start_codon:yes stop_codon:yes gene_type:complete
MSELLPRYYFKFYNPTGFPDGGTPSISTSTLIDVTSIDVIFYVTGATNGIVLDDRSPGEDAITLLFDGIVATGDLNKMRYYLQDVLENLRSQSWTNNVHEFGDSTTGEFSFRAWDDSFVTTKCVGYKMV